MIIKVTVSMMSKAQTEFRTRSNTDSREFDTWYDNEDVQRLIWQIYQNIPADNKHRFLKPYVFYDNMEKDEGTLDKLLDACHQLLRGQNLEYLPFILKPKALPHFYAGFIHLNPDYIYIFDPVGTTLSNGKFRDCFHVSKSNQIGDLRVIVSSEQIQNTVYEDGLVSCGPLCVEFLDYIMTHPEVVSVFDCSNSIVPPQFTELAQNNLEDYRTAMVKIREKHDHYLSQLPNERLASQEFETFYQEITSVLLDLETGQEESHPDQVFQPTEPIVNYNTENVTQILKQIYKNIPEKMQERFALPCVFDTATADLEKQLSTHYQIVRKENLNYLPFLFKPKSSQYFYAGLILSNYIYLFIPNGAIPAQEKLEDHLGLSSKTFIANIPLVLSPQAQSRLPNNKSVSTLLSIEFLAYIMQHEKTFEKPQKFLELLHIHKYDYQSYIDKLSQKQKKYLAQQKPSVPSTRQQNAQNHITHGQQTYLRHFSELSEVIYDIEQNRNQQVLSNDLELALSEAHTVLNELQSLLPVTTSNILVLPVKLADTQLLRLAALCSHIAHGLKFISQNLAPYQADIFSYTNGLSGNLLNVQYDMTTHKLSMQQIRETALLLPGAGWHRLKTALFILAGVMIIVCGIVVATSSPSASLLFTLSGAATLSASIGFFASRDTGLADAASKLKMQAPTLTNTR